MRNACLVLALFACALPAVPGWADERATVAALERFLAAADTLSADFRQVSVAPDGEAGPVSSGRFYVSRPGRFRWEYVEPGEQIVVSDGTRLWMYDADLEQVTVRSVDDGLEGTPAMLLSGRGRLADSFAFGADEAAGGYDWIELLPRSERPEFRSLRVGLADGVIGAMEVVDSLDQITRIEFTDVVLGGDLAPELFRFEPPPGVDVIGQEDL